jgi:hypothetical protein
MLTVLLAAAALLAVSPVSAWAAGSATKTVIQDGLTVTLRATPGAVATGAPVHFVARAWTEHATGALVYGLIYGDGTSSRPVAIPQYCLAGSGRPAAGTWRFTHRYRAAGHYQVRFEVSVNCGGEHAAVRLTVTVKA